MRYTADKKSIFKALLGSTALLLMVLLMAACSDTEASAPEEDVDMTLNLQTLEVQTEFGPLQAQRADNSYVGSINDGQAIGTAFLDEVGVEDNQGLQREIVVYLYDHEELAVDPTPEIWSSYDESPEAHYG